MVILYIILQDMVILRYGYLIQHTLCVLQMTEA